MFSALRLSNHSRASLTQAPAPVAVRTGSLLALTALLLSGAALGAFYRSLHDSNSGLKTIFTSDTMFPGRLAQDLLRDGYRHAGWQYPAAPFWFPHITLFMLLQKAIGHVSGTVIAYGIVQVGLLFLAGFGLVQAIAPIGKRWLGVWGLAAGATLLSGA
ncbi:MAG: hypothetical protein ACRCZF_01025 [Gemmataceae bacterium]